MPLRWAPRNRRSSAAAAGPGRMPTHPRCSVWLVSGLGQVADGESDRLSVFRPRSVIVGASAQRSTPSMVTAVAKCGQFLEAATADSK